MTVIATTTTATTSATTTTTTTEVKTNHLSLMSAVIDTSP